MSPSHGGEDIIVIKAAIQMPMVKGHPAKGLVVIENNSLDDDVLMGAYIEKTLRVEIHESLIEAGISKMRKIEGTSIKAGDILDFENSHTHFMIFGLSKDLQEGDIISGKLIFKNSSEIATNFKLIKLMSGRPNRH